MMSDTAGVSTDLFYRLFDGHPSQVALLDLHGRILATNESWDRFGEVNGRRRGYLSVGVDYVEVCARAVRDNSPYAQEALAGIVGVLAGAHDRFTLRYPCHSPTERRWFKMLVERQTPQSPSVIIAHTYLGPERPAEAADPQSLAQTRGDRPPTPIN